MTVAEFRHRCAGLDRVISRELFRELFTEGRALTTATDAELADNFGVARPTISRWIRGVTCPATLVRRLYLRKLLRHVKGGRPMKPTCKMGLAVFAQALLHGAIGVMIGGWAGGVLLGASLISLAVVATMIPGEE